MSVTSLSTKGDAMNRWAILLLAVTLVAAGGCASTKSEDDISSIPWNRQQSWEGQGALGGFHPPGSPGN